MFSDYEWPGNIRELENTIERLVVMAKGETIGKSDLPAAIRELSVKTKYALQSRDNLPLTVEVIEKDRIIDALNRTGWVQARAARMLGITPRQIGYKIARYNIKQ